VLTYQHSPVCTALHTQCAERNCVALLPLPHPTLPNTSTQPTVCGYCCAQGAFVIHPPTSDSFAAQQPSQLLTARQTPNHRPLSSTASGRFKTFQLGGAPSHAISSSTPPHAAPAAAATVAITTPCSTLGPAPVFFSYLRTEEHRLRQAKALLLMRRACNV
jgi:hypothetical protein